MPEYFVYETSFPAPLVGDVSTEFITANTPEDALTTVRLRYSHPCGLFYVAIYTDANAYHKREKPLIEYHTKKAEKWLKERKERNI